MLGPQDPRHAPRIGSLVEIRIPESNGEGLHRPVGPARHQRDDAAGVDPSREERAQRDVADHVEAHRFLEQTPQLVGDVRFAAAGHGVEPYIPVAPDPDSAAGAGDEHVARLELLDARDDALIGRGMESREE